MDDTIKIRELNIEEYGCLQDILYQQQLYHFQLKGPYSKRFLKINEVNFANFMRRKKNAVTYVAMVGNTIVGFSSAYVNHHKEGVIEDLFVLEAYRNKTIGTTLFKKILKWLEENQVLTIDIHVSIGNENVISYYEKKGFKVTGYTMMKENGEKYEDTD